MLKMPHDPTRIVPPRARLAVAAAVVAIVVAGSTAAPVTTNAMKMRHDCCVSNAPIK